MESLPWEDCEQQDEHMKRNKLCRVDNIGFDRSDSVVDKEVDLFQTCISFYAEDIL